MFFLDMYTQKNRKYIHNEIQHMIINVSGTDGSKIKNLHWGNLVVLVPEYSEKAKYLEQRWSHHLSHISSTRLGYLCFIQISSDSDMENFMIILYQIITVSWTGMIIISYKKTSFKMSQKEFSKSPNLHNSHVSDRS